jgi:hypothetical protein
MHVREAGPSRRRNVAVVVGACGLLTAIVTPSGTGSAAGGRSFSDGSWSGSMAFTASIPVTGSHGVGGGSFSLDVDAGEIAGPATWNYVGVSGLGAGGAASVVGRLGGAADAPLLFPEIITSGGVTVDNTGAPGLPLEITAATCEMVEGTGEGQPPVDVDARWTAVRADSVEDLDTFAAESAEIATALFDLERAIASGETPDRSVLSDIIDRALELTGSLDRSPDCSPFGEFHRMVAADVVAWLLGLVLTGDLEVDTQWFADIVLAATGAGAIGAGATDIDADDLELAVIDELFTRVEAAAAADDVAALLQLGALAYQLGYRSIEDAVTAAFEDGS